MKKKNSLLFLLLMMILCVGSVNMVWAGETTGSTSNSEEVKVKAQVASKGGWKKNKKGYRWQNKDGSYLKKTGWVTLGGKRYYLKEGGYRKEGILKYNKKYYYLSPSLTYGTKKVNGKTYLFDSKTGAARTGWQTLNKKKCYFLSDGTMAQERWVKYKNHYYYIRNNGTAVSGERWLNVNNKRYYIGKQGYRVTGLKKISGKRYFFNSRGELVKNKSDYKINGKYYNIDSNGVATSISELKVQCQQKAREFVQKHTNSRMTNSQKFRSCFNYLIGYTEFKPWINPTDAEFKTSTWPYKYAIYMFDNGLSGSCYGIASAVAACASVLGYEPYVIATTGDHGFVMIDGLYYDNMGPLFGSYSHSAYYVRSKVKF